jgi:hypothetical protein
MLVDMLVLIARCVTLENIIQEQLLPTAQRVQWAIMGACMEAATAALALLERTTTKHQHPIVLYVKAGGLAMLMECQHA